MDNVKIIYIIKLRNISLITFINLDFILSNISQLVEKQYF